jgi:hypothetical protein
MQENKKILEPKRLDALKWEIHKVNNWLVEGRVIYAHRQAKATVSQFQFEIETLGRLNQANRMISRMRHGEIIDAYNDSKSLFDCVNKLITQ